MSARGYAIILLVIIMVTSIAYTPVTGLAQEEHRYLATIYVPTVIDEAKGLGGVVRIGIYAVKSDKPGVVVESMASIANDTAYAAKIAYIVAEKILGDLGPYEYHIVIETTGRVAGPSAGVAFTVLLMAAALGDNISQNLSMTGAIAGDGGAEGVSGLVVKAKATAENGLKEIVAPYVIMAPHILDQILKYNITVKPVANVLEAYYEATGRRLTVPYVIDVPPPVAKVFQDYAYNAIEMAREKFQEAVVKARKAYPAISTAIINNTEKFVNAQLNNAYKALSAGAFYSAASLAFTAYVNASTLSLYADIAKGQVDPRDYRNKLYEEAKELNKSISSYNYTTLGEFEVVAAAWYRIYMALESLNETTNGYYQEAANLAYAEARLDTAKFWFQLTDEAREANPVPINESLAEKIADYAVNYAELAYRYVKSIVVEIGASQASINALDREYELFKKATSKAKPPLAYAFAAEFASKIYYPLKGEATIAELTSRKYVERVLNGYREMVSYFDKHLIDHNISLIIAPAYVEYSEWVGDPYSAAQLVAMADAYFTPIYFAYMNISLELSKAPIRTSTLLPLAGGYSYVFIIVVGVSVAFAFTMGIYLGSKLALPKEIEEIRRSLRRGSQSS